MSVLVRIQMLAVAAGVILVLMALAVVYGGLADTALLISASVCALLLTGAGWFVAHSLQQSLNRLQASIKQVELRRDLSVVIFSGQPDYAGVESVINRLLGSFRDIVSKVNQNTESLFESGAKISVASADMAAGSDQQHDSADQITASITELSRSINKVAANAGQSRDISSETHELCLEGEQRVQSTTGGVAHVAESFQSALHLVRSLEGRSDEIGGIIEVIGDIADQTNLLALNAAIEAARAGEQGRGFAVVADEVRGLAERTRVATLEVSRMVEGIREQTSAVVATMEGGREQVEQCVEKTSGTALILSQIIDKSGNVQQRADGIAAEIDAQSRASDDLQQMAGSITETSRDNHDNIHKANDAVRQLLSEAIALNETVREYSVKERNALNSTLDCIVRVRMNAVLVSNSETVAETMEPRTEVERLDSKIEQYWEQYRQASVTCSEEQRLAADYQAQWLAFKEARGITFARACVGEFAGARANAANNAGPKFRQAKAALIALIDYHDKNKLSSY